MSTDDVQNCPKIIIQETFYMNNYSNYCRYLKQELTKYLEEILPKETSRPTKKFVYDMVYGILKTSSLHISEIARVLEKDNKLIHIEKRLTDNLSNLSLDKINDNLIRYSIEQLCDIPYTIDVDESDIIKPYGYKFEDLGYVHDGSKDGRPKEKGYSVIGIVAIGKKHTIIPLITEIYSATTQKFTSVTIQTLNYLKSIKDNIGDSFVTVFDRGYDGSILMNDLNNLGIKYVIRARSQRIYQFKHSKANIDKICDKIKGKYSTYFDAQNGRSLIQKFSSLKPRHADIKHNFWLVVESVTSDNDKRVYITNIDCSTKDACVQVIKSYRTRWRIEEYFRFIKGEFDFEKFRVRSLKSINNLSLMIRIATTFITRLVISKNSVYRSCLDAYSAFDKKSNDKDIVAKYGQNGLMLYRVKRGIQTILEHSNSVPSVPGRNRTKQKYYQLSFFDLKQK